MSDDTQNDNQDGSQGDGTGQNLEGYVMPGSTMTYTYREQLGDLEGSMAMNMTVLGFYDGEYVYEVVSEMSGITSGAISIWGVMEMIELAEGNVETGTVNVPGIGTTTSETYTFVVEGEYYDSTVRFTLVFGGLLYESELTMDIPDYDVPYIVTITMDSVENFDLGEYGEVDSDPITFRASGTSYTVTVSRISESVDGYYLYMVEDQWEYYIGDSNRIPAYAEEGATSYDTSYATIYFGDDGLTGLEIYDRAYTEYVDRTVDTDGSITITVVAEGQ